jgi:tetratricopeptide (TPR) repeat protein
MRRALLFAFVLATTLASAPPARAQNDVALTEAQARFKEGLDFADAGDHEAARLKFQQAWAVFKSPAVLYNLARSEQLTGHDIEAFEHFREFLKAGPDPKVTEAHRKKAQDNVSELGKRLGQIDLDVPPNTRVTVDGREAHDAAREPIPVQPGRHVVEAVLEGRIKSITVECGPGMTTKAKIEFETTVAGTTEPPSGGEPQSPSRVIVPATIGVVGLAALGVGVGFAVASQSAKDKEDALREGGICLDPSSPPCRELDDQRSDVNTKATVSTIAYVSGGVLLAAAAVTYIVWPSSKSSASRVVVSPMAGGGMVQLGGRF